MKLIETTCGAYAAGMLLALCVSSTPSLAQPSSARVTWQVSQDYINWSDHTSVENPIVDRVQVRALLTYQAPATYLTRFGMSMVDATITGRNGAGSADTVEGIYFREDAYLLPSVNQFVPSRVGGVLKIDTPGDTLAPGQGQGWMTSYQNGPFLQPLTDNLPVIVLYQYTLLLDGTSGVRDINAVFRQLNTNVPNSFVGIWAPGPSPNTWVDYAIPTEVLPATVRVNVPAPSPLAALLLAGAPLATRRRRPN